MYDGGITRGKSEEPRGMDAGEIDTAGGRVVLSSAHSTRVSLEAVRQGKAGLDGHRKSMLERAPEPGDDAVFEAGTLDIKDLAYLTAKTGDEFAILRGKDRDILWHGTKRECDVLPKYGEDLKTHRLELYGHSHPGEPIPMASLEDKKFLRHIGQKDSMVISGMTGIVVGFDGSY